MTFREDESRIRKDRGPLVFNVLRKIVMAMLKKDERGAIKLQAARVTYRLDFNAIEYL